jgi:hypothetical protein
MNEILENVSKRFVLAITTLIWLHNGKDQEEYTTNIKNIFKYFVNFISAINTFFMTCKLGSRLSKCLIGTGADVYIVDSNMVEKNIRIKPFGSQWNLFVAN